MSDARCLLRFMFWTGLVLSSPILSAQVKTSALTPAEFSKAAGVSRALIPGHAREFSLDKTQSFAVRGEGFPAFSILPAHFHSVGPEDVNPVARCGVFFLKETGPAIFLGTLGYADREPELCDELAAVGFMTMPAQPPRIILLYKGGSFNNPSSDDPVILDWNAATGRYVSNDLILRRLQKISSIAAIRAQLKQLDARP